MEFPIGSDVEIQTKMRAMYIGEEFKYVLFKGKIIPNEKWLSDEYVTVATGVIEWPTSVIHKRLIVGFQFSSERQETQFFNIKSSKGDKTYVVTSAKGKIHCECTGFQFRNNCKHADEVRQLIECK